jgi:hypothetical protein
LPMLIKWKHKKEDALWNWEDDGNTGTPNPIGLLPAQRFKRFTIEDEKIWLISQGEASSAWLVEIDVDSGASLECWSRQKNNRTAEWKGRLCVYA